MSHLALTEIPFPGLRAGIQSPLITKGPLSCSSQENEQQTSLIGDILMFGGKTL